ncbi:MAG: hypothetical protein COB10_11575 [Planctomycetota bacterium]|nr:MAG: hypothetical protein COB10_11575 [Planctomycetota bacterium]
MEMGRIRGVAQEPVRGLVLELRGAGGTTITIRRALAVIGLLDLAIVTTTHSRIVPRRCR